MTFRKLTTKFSPKAIQKVGRFGAASTPEIFVTNAKPLHTRSCSGHFRNSLRSGRYPLALNAKRTRSCPGQRILSCARCLRHAHICHSEELRGRVRHSSVAELSTFLLRDGHTGQHEEQLCGGGQTSTDPSVESGTNTTIANQQRQVLDVVSCPQR